MTNFDGKVTLTNTILVGLPGTPVCATVGGNGPTTWTDGGGNFSTDASCHFTQPSSHANAAPAALALGPLADNGGPTPTMALLPGSIANGAGSCAVTTDQCGRARPGPTDPACDSGAYELQAGAGTSCLADDDCEWGVCDGGCVCPSHQYTFDVTSSAGPFPRAEWPGGGSTQSANPGCSVTVRNPNADISLACGSGTPFSILSFSGYSSCVGFGGENGDGCQVTSCPSGGVGSCCNRWPSCSFFFGGGTASASYSVQCLQ